MRTVTLGGFGDAATAQQMPSAMPITGAQTSAMPVSRDSGVAFGIASNMMAVADAIPQIFLSSDEKAGLATARSVLADVVANQGRTDAGSVMARTQAASAVVQLAYNTAIQRRMYVVGGLVVLGVGGFLYYRKR